MAIRKVWIEDACISCNLCEDLVPEVFEVPAGELAAGLAAFELLRRAGLVKSNGEARRLIKGGGARINDKPLIDEMTMVTQADCTDEGYIKVSAGKKRHILVRPH